jgi:wyosine [tRNA(Phe)-imidazoG37] synthetase (radical SAM superfamily)
MNSLRGHVYGPVPSRRLGASLGVDVVPLKICPYDCIYCQLGPTRMLSDERAVFFPVEEILADVEARLSMWPPPDVITVAGSGEPTLYAGLGALINGIKRMTDTPVALLTNGALFHRGDVGAGAARADIVLPSLDADDEATFQLVNRPLPGLTLERVVDGLATFRREYFGEIRLEVMILAGITDTPQRTRAVARLAHQIAPDRIELNTPVRPTFDERAAPVSQVRLAELAQSFSPGAEVIAEWRGRDDREDSRAAEGEEVLALLRRRPCTVADVAAGLGLHPNLVVKTLAALEHGGEIHRVLCGRHVFWHTVSGAGRRLRGKLGKRE